MLISDPEDKALSISAPDLLRKAPFLTKKISHLVKGCYYGALMMENRPELLFALTGALKLGVTVGLVNAHQKGEALTHSLKLLKPGQIVVGAEKINHMIAASKTITTAANVQILVIPDQKKQRENSTLLLPDNCLNLASACADC